MSTYYLSRGDERFIFHEEHVTEGGTKPVSDTFIPVAVIPFEDREAVARLVELLGDYGWRPTEGHGLRAALREFANPKPPKPDEPTGLGAVAEDAEGNRWVRIEERTESDLISPWRGPVNHENYADIDVVRILSEGVQA